MNRARGINEITRRNAGKYDKRASQNVRNESRPLAIFKPFVPEIEPRNRVEILKSIYFFENIRGGSKLFRCIWRNEYWNGEGLRDPT